MDTAKFIYGTKVQTTQPRDGTDVYCKSKGVSGKHAHLWLYKDFSPYRCSRAKTPSTPWECTQHNKSSRRHRLASCIFKKCSEHRYVDS